MLRMAIQKNGRLNEKSLALMSQCGISIQNGGRKLKARARNFPLELLFLRDDDIPQYVAEGVADLGILGKDVLYEKGKNVKELLALGFSNCRLCIAIPKDKKYTGVSWLNNKRIATSFPNSLQSYLDKNNIQAAVEEISGSVEIAPGIGLADAICDLVSTGSTLLTNGLREVETILSSEAVLVGNDRLDEDKKALTNNLLFRINSVLNAGKNKYILMNAPNSAVSKIISLLPGMRSPTVLPLAQKGWSSIHSVISEDDFWEIIGRLKENGAEGILVSPIEKMIL